jgi:hypothetical protein
MRRHEVLGTEIEEVLEDRARDEIEKRAPEFVEWLADDPRTVKIVAALLSQQEVEGLLLLSMLKNDYVMQRKFQADPCECEQIAGEILDSEREGQYAD